MANKRTLKDNQLEERQVHESLELLLDDKKKLTDYEEDITNSQDSAIFRLKEIVDFMPFSRNHEFYNDLIAQMTWTKSRLQTDIDEKREALQKKERQLNQRLDDLYYERLKLYQQDED